MKNMGQRRVTVDRRRFLRVDGIKICRVTNDGLLEFKDKDGRRSRSRGSAYVTVYADQISQAVENVSLSEDSSDGGSGNSRQHKSNGSGIQSDNQEENNRTTSE